jgi:mannose-6-phosphate isomerase
LGEFPGKWLGGTEAHGESWEVSDHPLHRSVVATGPCTGRTLRDLMEREREGLLGPGTDEANFPWLVKFLDARDWLSVQVHPDPDAVRLLRPGEGSKTEAWFVLDADPGSRVYAGLRPGTDAACLRAALKAGTVADCLHSFSPRPGDCIFLPAGTVHAVGGGVLFAEVQQTSDATFRLFDWNRRDAAGRARELHIEEALASIDWNQGPVEPVRAAAFGAAEPNGTVHRQRLVRCPYFCLDYLQSSQPMPWGGEGRLQAMIVLGGGGRLAAHGQEEALVPGQVWLLPAIMPEAWCLPQPFLRLLLCTLPD